MAVVGTLAYNFSVVMPLMVRFVFHAGAGELGVLYSVMGAGAVAGGLVIAARSRATHFLLTWAALALGAALVGAGIAPRIGVELAIMLPVGAASTVFIATANTLLQLGASEQMRGRVMALFMMVFLGSTPIGGPLVGWLAERFGPQDALLVGAIATLVAGVIALARLRHLQRFLPESRPAVEPELAPAR
jgi:MFS family permease